MREGLKINADSCSAPLNGGATNIDWRKDFFRAPLAASRGWLRAQPSPFLNSRRRVCNSVD